MEPLIVVLVALGGLCALKPTDRQVTRSRSGGGHLRERLTLLRRLGLVRH